MALDVYLRCSPASRALGIEAATALVAAGLAVAAPDLDSSPPVDLEGSAPSGLAAARLCLILVTRDWSTSQRLRQALEAARAAGVRTILSWWDEDAPSDALGDRSADERVSIVYSCLLPRPERLPRLAEQITHELSGR